MTLGGKYQVLYNTLHDLAWIEGNCGSMQKHTMDFLFEAQVNAYKSCLYAAPVAVKVQE